MDNPVCHLQGEPLHLKTISNLDMRYSRQTGRVEVPSQCQRDQQDPFDPHRLCFVLHLQPVQVLCCQQPRDVCDPVQPSPAMFGRVNTKCKQQVFRTQSAAFEVPDAGQDSALKQVFQIEIHGIEMRSESPLQLENVFMGAAVKGKLVVEPQIQALLCGRELQCRSKPG